MEDEAICALVTRLARTHPSGGTVIERAAILAAGADSAAVLAWIEAHDGHPEAQEAPAVAGRGLHGGRLNNRSGAVTLPPRRYVLPPGLVAG
jgi:hypothetical protein